MTLKIGYVMPVFPYLSMTFVYREVLALRAKGVDVHTFATWKPDPEELPEEALSLIAETTYIFPLNWVQFIRNHITRLFTQPRRYLGTLFFVLSGEHKNIRSRLRTFYHFCEAVQLAQEVSKKEIEHLHAHPANNATTIALVVARLLDGSFSFTGHAFDLFADPILLPQKIESAEFVVCISEFNRQYLQQKYPELDMHTKTVVVRYGIDVHQFSPASDRSDNDTPLILSIGRLVEKKGFPFLIRACKILKDQGHNFQCLILGGGPEEESLQTIIEETDLADRVTLGGIVFQETVKAYLRKADIFVLPCIVAADQDMDGIPNTLIEAMAMKVPVVSTRLSGIPELIDHMKTGLLAPPNDETALADAIKMLLTSKQLRSTLGGAGRATIENEFEIGKSTEELKRLFEAIVG